MKRMLVYATALGAVALCAPALANAETAAARLSQTTVSVSNPGRANVNVHAKFASVDSVCFAFTFTNDMLDPGELLRITPLRLLPSLSGPAISDTGTEPQDARTICVIDPGFVSIFADGKEHKIEIGMESGSVEIAQVVVTVTGTPR